MRLIDVDKIKLDYSGLMHISPYDFIGTAKYFADQIKSAPTVDAVEVVRCKDCKHNYEEFIGLVCVKGVCVDCIVPEDFYCSYGERKELSK